MELLVIALIYLVIGLTDHQPLLLLPCPVIALTGLLRIKERSLPK